MWGKPTTSGFSLFKHLRRKNALRICLIFLGIFFVLHMTAVGKYCIKTLRAATVSMQADANKIIGFIGGKFFVLFHAMCGDVDKILSDLRCENIRLHQLIENLRNLEQENEKLRKLMRIKDGANNSVTVAEVITIFSNSFARSAILNVGTSDDISLDNIVRNENGLVGRIIEVSDHWSRMLLITDANSNIPVRIGEANVMAGGDNSAELQITVQDDVLPIYDGDFVETSGYGEVFVEKIPVGRVKKDGDRLSIIPFADFNQLKYVSVIQKVKKEDEIVP
jgi:rod shape-determining protein MreC